MSWQTPENLSADEIAVMLGYANAAAMVAAIANSVFGAVPLTVGSDSGDAAAHLYASNSPSVGEVILNAPAYLSLQIAGATVAYLSNALNLLVSNIQRTADTGQLNLCGGSAATQANGAIGIFYGNSRSGAEGWASYYTGSASGAKHSFFDKNGVERLRITEGGAKTDSFGADFIYANAGGNLSINCGWATPANILYGFAYPTNDPVNAAGFALHGASASYPGAHQQFAPLVSHTAQVAKAIAPIASGSPGDTALILVMGVHASLGFGCWVFVDYDGVTISLRNHFFDATTVYVNSSSPGASEVGIYISAGVLYCKTGSAYAGGYASKFASFSLIGKG